ncbi:MAG TPA: radical SAM protein [Alphaproteobacteria bacterium]|nr:radical SAM protein [Alphaproteobacteria bacterium]
MHASAAAPLNRPRLRVLIVDLNNFTSFPTLAVGILVAGLRGAGHDVQVICPLAYGVPASFREGKENPVDAVKRRIHLSTSPSFRKVRDFARDTRQWWINRPHPRVLRETARALDDGPDIVLLSAYLQHYPTVAEIGKLAAGRNIPLLLGGPMFNVTAVSEQWRQVPGLAAIVGGEADLIVSELVEAVCGGEDLLRFNGVLLPTGDASPPAPPLRRLDKVPVADFTDFPWDRYPFRVVPVMTGRGCQWAKCVFCSDVITANGRTFRTRSAESVLTEMREQARRHQTTNFLFIDIKLNSNPNMLRALSDGAQRYVPGAEWIGTVHVDMRADNGLSRRELKAAVAGGMRRVSFGLETGSQKLLDAMDKGSTVEKNSEFIRHAYEAGLSVRCTMFKGFPGETAEDLMQTAEFLEEHAPYLDRVRFNEFNIIDDTPIYEAMRARAPEYENIKLTYLNHRHARAKYINKETEGLTYRRAKARALRAVAAINRKEVRRAARAFDGMM